MSFCFPHKYRPLLYLPPLVLGAVAGALGLSGCGSGINNAASADANAPIALTNAPQLGYFWAGLDATLRPILGVPGGSQVGASVTTAGAYVTGAASSASGLAILQAPDGSLDLMTLPNGTPAPLSAKLSPGVSIRFSPGGATAIAFAPGDTAVTLLSSLKTAPAATVLSSNLAVTDAAVSDSGHVVIAAAGATGVTLSLLGSTNATTPLATAGSLGGLTFAGPDDLLFADATANTLILVHNASTAPVTTQLATAGLLKSPVALAASADAHWAVVANGSDPSVVRVDLTAGTAPLTLACSCTPTGVFPLNASGSFRVTGPGTGPVWAVEAAAATPRAFFIPALAGVTVKP